MGIRHIVYLILILQACGLI